MLIPVARGDPSVVSEMNHFGSTVISIRVSADIDKGCRERKLNFPFLRARVRFYFLKYTRLHEYAKTHRGVPTAHFSPNNEPVELRKKAEI